MVQDFVLGELMHGFVVLKLECVNVVVPGGDCDDSGWMEDFSDLNEHILLRFECRRAKINIEFRIGIHVYSTHVGNVEGWSSWNGLIDVKIVGCDEFF